jgi:hypothetical protein
VATNTLLTPQTITKASLAILHQKLTFVGSINRQYDDSFARDGAKIGDSLKIRLPNQYTVQTGATFSAQNTVESSVTLQVATQKHVDIEFSSAELTLTIDRFAERYLEPAMTALAANIEADALTGCYKEVYNMVDGDAAAPTFLHVMQARQKLNDYLAPFENRTALLSTSHTAKLVNELKGLFQDSAQIAKQYREGELGRIGGFDFKESTHIGNHTTGTAAKTTGYVTGAAQSGSTITVATGTTTFKKGDVVTFAGVNAVHAETKADLGYLQQFVITADAGPSATSILISPAIVATGATQNVSAAANSSAVVKIGAGANELLTQSLVYQKNFATIAFADLVMPKGVDFSAREVLDGISLRIVRMYDIGTDTFPCRLDVYYGYKVIRPQLACRVHADG